MMLAWLSTTRALAQDTRLGNTRAEAGSSEVFMRERNVAKHWGLRFRAAPTRNAFAEARLKERRKIAEEMKKPQYADKMYFGHKRPPKKRPLHKRKFCKECGIVH
ncbi:MAG: hypothetical protein RMJ87_09000 [Cytophagales bacterium]|nr:hypothetical protein [Bernardetiaceae bacterium]MDW8205151.1 hypothetical protein [Cytophagales bacterium]